jgi:ABC-type antimicrobial peptide transport system permease subunit
MALGASRWQTLKTAAASGVGLAVCGTALGLVLSLLVSGVMRQLVFGVPVNDPLTLAVGAGVVVLAASAAAIVPALRTLRLNLVSVLNNR